MPPAPHAVCTSDSPKRWLPWFGLGLAILLVYSNTFHVPLLLDDEISIAQNESLIRLSDLKTVLFPRTDVFTAGRPLLNLSFALNYAVHGTAPTGYHVVNLGIHWAAVITLAGLVRRTLLLPRWDGRFAGSASWIALAAALLWGLHPVLTSSVTYVSQRAESLMGLCYLATLYAFVRATERPGFWSIAACAVCLAGMMVKEVMVTAPVAILLFDVVFVAGSLRSAWRERGALHLSLAATWIVLAAVMSGNRLEDRGVGYGLEIIWYDYARIELGAVLHYLRLAVLPHPLIFDYGEPAAMPKPEVVIFQLGVLLALVGMIGWAWHRNRPLAYVGGWFFLTLAPTSSVVPIAGQPIAESRVYLPLIAIAVLVAVGLSRIGLRRATLVLLLLATALGWSSLRRNADFGTELGIWTDTVRKRPTNARAHGYLGNALLRAGRTDEALAALQLSVKLNPQYPTSYIYIGTILMSRGRLQEGLAAFQRALALRPNQPVALSNLGTLLFQLGRADEAISCYRQALQLRPADLEARQNLAIVLGRLGRFDESIVIFEGITRDYPASSFARENLQQLRSLRAQAGQIPAR